MENKDLGSTTTQMETSMKENGKMISKTEKEIWNIQVDQNMTDSGRKAKNMEEEYIFMTMEWSSMEILHLVENMEMVVLNFQMGLELLDFGITIIWKVRGRYTIVMETTMKAIFIYRRNQVKAHTNGQKIDKLVIWANLKRTI